MDMERSGGGGRRPSMQIVATAGLVIVAVVTVLLQQHQRTGIPAASASVLTTASATATPLPAVPSEDLAAANLAGASALVAPFRLVARDGTGKTLIGAYADATRTVLFFRGPTASPSRSEFTAISVYDSHGFLNGGTMGGQGIPGDSFFALDLGPRVAQDGLAHLTVTDTFPQESFTAPPPSTGWAFQFTLRVHPTIALPAPSTFQLASWKVTIEDLSATPSVIDFQAVVAGANNEQLFNNMQSRPVMLIGAAGDEVRPITATSGVTVPKQQLNATTYQNTRVHYQWARPVTAATYQLRISGNGATHVITLQIPAP